MPCEEPRGREGEEGEDPPVTTMRLAWILILSTVLLLEGIAIGRPALGDTISENVWMIRSVWLGRAVVGAVLAWIFWHIVIDRDPRYGWGDALAIVIGIVTALMSGARRQRIGPRL